MRTPLLAALAVTVTGCGSSTTQPAPVNLPPPAAQLVALTGQELAIPNWPCPTGECRYRFTFRNQGPDCARAVRGTFRLLRPDGVTVLATDEWSLDPARMVAAQEQVEVEDGPIPLDALQAVGTETGRFAVTFAFDAVRCQ